MDQHFNQQPLNSKDYRAASSILRIQFSKDNNQIESVIEQLLMVGKITIVGVKGNRNININEVKKLNACILKIEEGLKFLTNENDPKQKVYGQDLKVLKAALNKIEKGMSDEETIEWWRWILIFLIPYWWIFLIIGIVMFLLIKLS